MASRAGPLGSVEVDVGGNLDKLMKDFATAEKAADAFYKRMQAKAGKMPLGGSGRGAAASATANKAMEDGARAAERYGRNLARASNDNRQFAQSSQQVSRNLQVVTQNFNQAERASSGLKNTLLASAGAFAAAIGANQISGMLDSYTRFTNQLKVAGLESGNLAEMQEKLFTVAQRNGVELEAIGTLYSRAAQNQKELGASTGDLVDLTRAVSASLRISGTSTNEASGALLQLGQALGSPRVQAEEFNSLLDTMQPLLRGAAKYIDGTGGSLSGLTRKIKDTNGAGVSNVQLFQAIIKSMNELEGTAARSNLTIAGSWQVLTNAVTKYAGEQDRALGATQIIGGAMMALANNLDTVAEAVIVLSTVMAARFVSSMVASTVAGTALAASNARAALTAEAMAGATYQANAALLGEAAAARIATASVTNLSVAQGLAARSGSALLALVGGPIGAAVIALGAAVAYLSSEQMQAQASAQALTASIEALSAKTQAMRDKKAQAAAETGHLTKAQREALTATANLTGEANLLANAWARVAAEAKRARVEQAMADYNKAQSDTRAAQTRLDNARQVRSGIEGNNRSWRPNALIGRAFDALGFTNSGQQSRRLAEQERQAQQQLQEARRNEEFLKGEATRVVNARLSSSEFTPTAAPGAPSSGSADSAKALAKHRQTLADLEKLKASASGKELATVNKKIAREQAIVSNLEKGVGETAAIAAASGGAAGAAKDTANITKRYNDEMARGNQEILDVQRGTVDTAEARRDIESDRIEFERASQERAIKAEKDYSDAQKRNLLDINERLAKAKRDALNLDALSDKRRETYERANEQLESERDIAKTATERRAVERRILDARYAYERSLLQAILNNPNASDSDRADATDRMGALDQRYRRSRTSINLEAIRDGQNTAPEGSDAYYRQQREGLNRDANERIGASKERAGARIEQGEDPLVVMQQQADEELAIRQKLAEDIQKIENAKRDVILGSAQSIADNLAQITGTMAGKQSGIYRAMFAVSKAFAIADAALSLYQNIANASKIGFPQNIPFIAGAVAQGASIVANISAIGFQKGGWTGSGADSDEAGVVHRNEYVFDANAVRRIGRANLDSIRKGRDPGSALAATASGSPGGLMGQRQGNSGLSVKLQNFAPGVRHEVQQGMTRDEFIIIAREEGAKGSAAQLANPNSAMSKAVSRHTTAKTRKV